MKKTREQIKTADGEAEGNSMCVFLYEKKEIGHHLIHFRAEQRRKQKKKKFFACVCCRFLFQIKTFICVTQTCNLNL